MDKKSFGGHDSILELGDPYKAKGEDFAETKSEESSETSPDSVDLVKGTAKYSQYKHDPK
jgi:hypothetical protein